jgi:hypothetical protein
VPARSRTHAHTPLPNCPPPPPPPPPPPQGPAALALAAAHRVCVAWARPSHSPSLRSEHRACVAVWVRRARNDPVRRISARVVLATAQYTQQPLAPCECPGSAAGGGCCVRKGTDAAGESSPCL